MFSTGVYQQTRTVSTTSELLLSLSQKVFPGMGEAVVFPSLEGMSGPAAPALGSDINSSVVSHVKKAAEGIRMLSSS